MQEISRDQTSQLVILDRGSVVNKRAPPVHANTVLTVTYGVDGEGVGVFNSRKHWSFANSTSVCVSASVLRGEVGLASAEIGV